MQYINCVLHFRAHLVALPTNPPECSHRVWSRNGREGCSGRLYDVITQMVYSSGTFFLLWHTHPHPHPHPHTPYHTHTADDDGPEAETAVQGWSVDPMEKVIFIKGEVRTINDRNIICERRSCMKNNGKSPTFKFVSGEERRPSEVQRVSRGWRLPGATHPSVDLTWIRKLLEIQAPELSEPESVELELGR